MKNLSGIQIISIYGIFFSIAAQLVLLAIGKKVENIWMLYPTWVIIFLIGWLIKSIFKGGDHHHHH